MTDHAKASLRPEETRNLNLPFGESSSLGRGGCQCEGFENIHLAFVQLENGQEHYENEAFSDAREDWATGRSRAQTSKSAFEAVADNNATPENFRRESIPLIGTADTVIKAFDKFVAGAEEAEAGNVEDATNLIREGFEILGQL